MDIRLNGKVALVTGAARGIGAAVAQALAEAGATVVITDVLADLGQQTAADLRDQGLRVQFMQHNVVSEDDWQRVVADTVASFGGLDVLVNNAGIEETGPLHAFEVEDFRRLLDVNVLGTFLGMKHAFRSMAPGGVAGRGGAVLNLSSMSALLAQPCFGPYGATKSAVERLTKVGAVEAGKLGMGVRVNCLYPGIIQTDMQTKLSKDLLDLGFFPDAEALRQAVLEKTPLGRVGSVEDVARCAVFLCSEQADFLTGLGLPIDGGMHIG